MNPTTYGLPGFYRCYFVHRCPGCKWEGEAERYLVFILKKMERGDRILIV